MKRLCFICNNLRDSDDNEYKESVGKISDTMTVYQFDTSKCFYNAANRLKRKISYEAQDFHAADISYHSSCYIKFALKSLSTIATEEQNTLELNASIEFCLKLFSSKTLWFSWRSFIN